MLKPASTARLVPVENVHKFDFSAVSFQCISFVQALTQAYSSSPLHSFFKLNHYHFYSRQNKSLNYWLRLENLHSWTDMPLM